IGKSAYTEFRMKDGDFHETDDGIYLGTVEAKDAEEAYEKIKNLEWNKRREFDTVMIVEVKKKHYF
ncbi:MAG: hypothetical protein QXW67_04060, partial [Candidatus Micrarchaeia archaeon]